MVVLKRPALRERRLIAGVVAAALLTGAASAQALPDWKGVWSPGEGNLFDPSAGAGGRVGVPGAGAVRNFPPYKPEWEEKYRKQLAITASGKSIDPTADCVPPGMPRVMTSPFALEFILEPEKVSIIREYQSQVIRIYTDGSKLPAEPEPTFNGASVGRWEGDTLVSETVGMRADTVYDRSMAPHSEALKVTMRLRKVDADTIENVMTMDDPVAFTKPWVVKRTYKRQPGWKMMEYVCEENNRNTVDK